MKKALLYTVYGPFSYSDFYLLSKKNLQKLHMWVALHGEKHLCDKTSIFVIDFT